MSIIELTATAEYQAILAAKTAAESAETNSETAEVNAETAETNAEAAASAAADSAGAAANYTSGMYKGIAATATVPVVVSGVPQWWIGSGSGTYTNFGGLVVAANFVVLSYNGTAWSKYETSVTPDIGSVLARNLFDKYAVVINKFINTGTSGGGDIITLSGAKISEQIPVLPNTQYTISGLEIPSTGELKLRYEDSNHVKISSLALTTDSTTFTTPTGCVYVVFGVFRADHPTDYSLVQMELGSTAMAFQPYTGEDLVDKINGCDLIAKKIKTEIGFKTLLEYITEKSLASATTIETGNLFDKYAVVINKFIITGTYEGGDIMTLSGAKISEQIPVLPNTQYTISGLEIPSTGELKLRYEDSIHVKISSLALTTATTTFTTPTGCAYVVFGVFRVDHPTDYSLVQMELGSSATAFQPYTDEDLVDKINGYDLIAKKIKTEIGFKTLLEYITDKSLASATTTETGNLFDKTAITSGYYINTLDGVLTPALNWAVSDFMPVEQSTDYYISGRTAHQNVAYYDFSKNLINTPPNGFPTWNSQLYNGKFTTGPTTAFVRMNVKNGTGAGDLDTIQFEKGSVATVYRAYGSVLMVNRINGQKILAETPVLAETTGLADAILSVKVVAFGDSITSIPTNWTVRFEEVTNILSLTNMAISGAKIAWRDDTIETSNPPTDGAASSNNVLWNQIKKWEATGPLVPNAIIIAMITNDVTQLSTMGTMEGAFAQDLASTSQLTASGAFRKALQYLINLYPNTQIFYCTPIQSKHVLRTWDALNSASSLCASIAKRLNVKVIDCFNESGIVMEYEVAGGEGRYLYDGTHPKEAGAIKQGDYIANVFLNSYVK